MNCTKLSMEMKLNYMLFQYFPLMVLVLDYQMNHLTKP